jgi:hypothetical protein
MAMIAPTINGLRSRPVSGARSRWTRGVLAGLGLASTLGLASCGGDDCGNSCFSNTPLNEISLGLVAGDFAGNGLSSVIQASIVNTGYPPNPGSLKTYLATAAGTYAAPLLSPTGNGPTYLAAADLNGDHLPDVVVANSQDGTLQLFFNSAGSPGTFGTPVVLNSPGASQVAIADMNGDGLPDLVAADFNVSLFLQISPGVFGNATVLDTGGANWVAIGDLNHDGSPDVTISDYYGVKVAFHTGPAGSNSYAVPTRVYTESGNAALYGANVVAVADVNGDGFDDLIITDPGPAGASAPFVAVMLQSSTSPGTFAAPVAYATAPGTVAQSLQVVDIDGDGLPDIIVGADQAVSVLLNTTASPGSFGAATNYAAANTNQIAIADVNGDGLPDIITTSGVTHALVNNVYTNEPGVLLQDAAAPGTFTALQNLP